MDRVRGHRYWMNEYMVMNFYNEIVWKNRFHLAAQDAPRGTISLLRDTVTHATNLHVQRCFGDNA
jgi:hypothetical protein